MTTPEFLTEFKRLCAGFRYEPTKEQADAWFKRIGHNVASDWACAVDTLLCAPRFPLLDPVLAAIDDAATYRRRVSVERDKPRAQRIFQQIHGEAPRQGNPLSSGLFEAIRAFAGRDQVRDYIAQTEHSSVLSDDEKQERLNVYRMREQKLSADLARLLPDLGETELSEFVDRYGAAVSR